MQEYVIGQQIRKYRVKTKKIIIIKITLKIMLDKKIKRKFNII